MPSNDVRLGSIQVADLWKIMPAEANPYSGKFSVAALEKACLARLDAVAGQLDLAGTLKCDLVTTTEDILGLGRLATYLDDASLFRRFTSKYAPIAAERVAVLAKRYRMHVVACYYELSGKDVFNVGVLFDRKGGIIGKYRKVHLPVYETWQVKAGSEFFSFDTDIGSVGIVICYDIMWPESVTACMLKGAEIICHPTASSPKEFRVMARALDNQVHYITSTYSNSMIVSPKAEVLANALKQTRAVVYADIDVKGAILAREHYFEYLYSGIRDHKERHFKLRHPEAYAVLCNPKPPLASKYSAGGLADKAEDIRRVYAVHKAEMQKAARGEQGQYDWGW